MFLPKQYVWKETFPFDFKLQLINLRKAALQDGSHSLAKAKRLWSEGHQLKAKKNLVHGLRFLNFAKQLIDTFRGQGKGVIFDVTGGANQYWQAAMENKSSTWQEFENKFKPIYQQYFHYLEHSVEVLALSYYPTTNLKQLFTVLQIEKYGLQSLSHVRIF